MYRGLMQIKDMGEIREFLQKIADTMQIEIVDLTWKDSLAELTVYIDNDDEKGVDLDTCEKFHNAIFEPLDEFDPTFDKPYTLNVSSPGLDRAFTTNRDYEKNVGKEVELKLYAPLKGKKFYEGVLLAFDDNTVTVKCSKEEIKFARGKIAKINKAIKFE